MIPGDHDEVDLNDFDPETDRQDQNHRYALEKSFWDIHLLFLLGTNTMMMMKVMVMEDMALEYSAPLSKRIVAESSSYIQ